jgi:hypothetical protein
MHAILTVGRVRYFAIGPFVFRYILACLVTTEKFPPNSRKVDSKEGLDVCANVVNLASLQ